MRLALCLAVLLVTVSCSRDDEGVLMGTQESFVAKDAGQIPLTSPGTPTRTERPVVEIPIGPFDEIPQATVEEPLPPIPDTIGVADTPSSPRRTAPAPRQQRRSDTVIVDSAGVSTLPLVTPRPDTGPRTPTPPDNGPAGDERDPTP